jgi:hypothetical protein
MGVVIRSFVLVLGGVLGIAACDAPRTDFACAGNTACRNGTQPGVCEESGFCSFPDGTCSSGSRYGEASGDGLAGQCVEEGPDPLGAWSSGMRLPIPRYSAAGVTANERIYILGGILGTTAHAAVTVGEVSNNPVTGGAVTWTETTALPEARRAFGAASDGVWVYAIGGRPPMAGDSATVHAAPINNDGSLGAWQATTDLPVGLRCMAVASWNQHAYVVGGKTGNMTIGNVLAGRMADGSIDQWRPVGSVGARACLAAVAANGYLYVIGGCSKNQNGCVEQAYADVQYAKINDDGSLGDFVQGTPLPAPRWHHVAAAGTSHLVVIGGRDPTNATNSVYTTHLNIDGSLGAWRQGNPIPDTPGRRFATVVGGSLFVISSQTHVAPFE